MRGELIAVWPETWREIWQPLSEHELATGDLFSDLYRDLSKSLKAPPSVQLLAETLADPVRALAEFQRATPDSFASERSLVKFFERANDTVSEYGADPLTNQYFGLVDQFIDKYSLRYDLRRPFMLAPTVTGISVVLWPN